MDRTDIFFLENKPLFSGKIRDVYKYNEDKLLIKTSDKISAYDFVFDDEGRQIGFGDTPLGRRLLSDGQVTEEELSRLKEHPLVYLKQHGGSHRFVNIIDESQVRTERGFQQKSLDECCRMIEAIDWEKSGGI